MKLTKKLETEIRQLMDKFWSTYFEGDLQTWANFLPDHYHNIGTTQEEIWNSKKEILDYTNRVASQMTGMADLRNKLVQVIPYDPYFMVHELGDLYIKTNDGWAFYAKIRMSSLLEKTAGGWKVLHQHGSYPDSKTEEGETFAFEKISRENLELKDAVKRRTIELENKTRELEIETSLERVRTIAMGMHTPDDILEICKVVFIELQSLGFKDVRNALINFWDDDNKLLKDYDYSDLTRGNVANIAYSDHPAFASFQKKIRQAKDAFVKLVISKDQLDSWKKRRKNSGEYDDPRLDKISTLYYYFYSTGVGAFGISTFCPISKENVEVLKRFRNVFDLAYRRYRDIQKAEAQTREASIELGLERVRTRAMAMQNSSELKELIGTVFTELTKLDLILTRCVIWVFESSTNASRWWMANSEEPTNPMDFYIKYHEHPAYLCFVQAWKKQNVKLVYDLKGDDKVTWDEILFNETELQHLPDSVKNGMQAPEKVVLSGSFNNFGGINVASLEPLADEHFDILLRFAKVFDLTYTRFLDLQKAEAQAKETKIELGLERVRSRAMRMRSSTELGELVAMFFEELVKLDLVLSRCIIWILDGDTFSARIWMANSEDRNVADSYFIKRLDHPYYDAIINGWKERLPNWIYDLKGDEKKSIDALLLNETELIYLPEAVKAGIHDATETFISGTFNNFGFIEASGPVRHSQEQIDILNRFGKVFDLCYTRFNDLKQAEEQTREAQIELSLERIRSRVTAMKISTDLLDIVVTMRTEFVSLGHEAHYFWYMRWLPEKYEKAMTSGDGTRIGMVMELPRHIHGNIPLVASWEKSDAPLLVYAMDTEAAVDYVDKMVKLGDFKQLDPQAPTLDDIRHIGGLTFVMARTTHGEIGFSLPGPIPHPPADSLASLVRFAAVFDLAYRRFEDLKGSEKQIRETQIELALERVRARTMAMQHSDELAEASFVLDTQVRLLGIPTWGCAFNIYGDNESSEWFSSEAGTLPTYKTPREDCFLRYYNAGQQGEQLYIEEFEGADCAAHYEYLCTIPIVGDALRGMIAAGGSLPTRQVDHLAFFKYGYLLFITLDPAPDAHDVFIRFAKVFEQTYIRFLDLQKAEAQARESQIEAALERVRSKAMAMHNSQDLSDTIHTFYSELKNFSITPRRCGVGLLDKESRAGELFTWNTTEQGESLELVGRLIMEGHPVLEKVYEGWITQTDYYPVLRGNEIREYYKVIRPQMGFPDYAHDAVQYGYFFFFSEGGVYAWTQNEMKAEELQIYRRFTSVLSLTYKRYKDLQQAETLAEKAEHDLILLKEEKKRTEDALAELQVTQKQLVQSEKMASLGELTAGIAHEIQNPLNFVNNFSDVSNELIDEMRLELDKGEIEEAKAIAADVKQNLEKITHHGKRADAIVKGMLQHSRSSSGTKEPTDINALCDEYLRLSYHGLRAKDKSFNVTLKTDFDSSVGKISVVPQDLGRAVLNLLTNAFYAVNEKRKSASLANSIDKYEPTVSVKTKRDKAKVEIEVKDNGGGIPKKILDKVFQPFFTTKPSGQGTGLGLSLSYDIITKGHGGELSVVTNEKEGTSFIIVLPY